MLANIALARPLAFIDLETTGLDPARDRIVEISVLRVPPAGQPTHRTRRLDPGLPIPPEATAVHGIGDSDVAGLHTFKQVARGLLDFVDGCDLCGFNLKAFDLRVLRAELQRCGLELPLEGRAVIDLKEIFHRLHPRDLAAAVRLYLGREHAAAHSAAADVTASAEILDAMLAAHVDLPRDAVGLSALGVGPGAAGSDGFFRRVGVEIRVVRGNKYRGWPLNTVAADPEGRRYLTWMLTADFAEDTKAVVREALTSVGTPA